MFELQGIEESRFPEMYKEMIRIIVNGVNRSHIDLAFDFNDIFDYTPQRFRC